MRLQFVLVVALGATSFAAPCARAQISDDVVKIGVLNDQTGLYADLGGTVLGKPIEIVFADHQNKSDIGVAIAREPHRGRGRQHSGCPLVMC